MLLKNLADLDRSGIVGDWCFLEKDTRIAFIFGDDNFHDLVTIPISLEGGKKHWKWNGSKDKPTLEPSILVHETNVTKGWHGFMREGKLISV